VRRSDLMHLHENPKGSTAKISAAGQPCKIGEDNRCNSEQMRFRDLAARFARGLLLNFPPSKTEGAGKTGCSLHPRSRVLDAHKEHAHEHTGSAEAFRPSLRSGLTAYFVLSPENGSLASVAAQGVNPTQLDASTAASGPHDFAVRFVHARLAHMSRPPHLTARS
jgi:hypothetical protein